ncbi:MAG: ABC transporter permease [Candidatus Diapherotrites archaeon]|uniref:ABC transporter permease n=1 Tax=Candidatus Iainarchaeum sp. TaxID=3101447 RepID=A0A938YPM9_9ARCH|nr:ABC transporter permease [Candidatus Diapherotrites archaeon]
MKIANSFKLSLNSIMHRRLRSWLTLLGIIIGVAAVVSIISIGEGAQASVSERLSELGADIITASPGYSRAGGFFGAFRGGRELAGRPGMESDNEDGPILTKLDAAIIRGNPNVEYVTEIVSGMGELVYLAEKANVSIEGVNPIGWRETSYLKLESGRFLGASDATAIVIGNRIANDMFKQPITIGRRVAIEGKSFTVVGILEASGSGFGGGGSDSTVYMPYTSAWEITDVEKDTFSSIQAKVIQAELVEETTVQITQSLMLSRKVTEQDQDFSITSSQAMQEQIAETTQTLTLFLGAIAAISLLVGAVGVANSMFTSVLEKTKLIGILKALGTKNREILTIFMIESGLFGFVGGILGVILGTLISIAIGSVGIIDMPMMGRGGSTLVSPQLVIVAIAISTIVGIVAGILPARAAAKLKPVEALRYE